MDDKQRKSLSSSQWSLIFLILIVATGSLAYRLIVWKRLEQTSLLFIGIPALLAIVAACTPRAKTTTGGIMKGMTIALLLSGPLLGEGFICIVMAAPIFYLVGLLVGIGVDRTKRRKAHVLSCLVLILAPMMIEGTSPDLSFDRHEVVRISRIVQASPEEVERAISRSPRTDGPLPLYLRLGFPRPVQATGSGLETASMRTIHFAGGEGHPGDLVLKVEESRAGYVKFAVVSDGTKIAHWLDWKSSEVEWSSAGLGRTRVTWTLDFERRLDPAWYFRPWERYAVSLAAEHLIAANATPGPGESNE